MYTYICIYIYTVSRICAAVSLRRQEHTCCPDWIAPVCLCFVAPKRRPDSEPKTGVTILRLVAQLSNLWPQFWAHGICPPSAKSALSCDRLHLSLMFSWGWRQDADIFKNILSLSTCISLYQYIYIYINMCMYRHVNAYVYVCIYIYVYI